MNELQLFWRCPPIQHVGRSWFPPSQTYRMFVTLFTDASKYAWGAHFHSTHIGSAPHSSNMHTQYAATEKPTRLTPGSNFPNKGSPTRDELI